MSEAPVLNKPEERRWDRGAWLTALLTVALLLWGAVIVLYLFTVPTDGWLMPDDPAAPGSLGYVYTLNLMHTPSGLQPGDKVIAVEGVLLAQEDLSSLADKWQVGNTLHYEVVREGKKLEVQVPLVRWQAGAAWDAFFTKSGGLWGLMGQLAFLVIGVLTFYKRPSDHAARTLLLLASVSAFSSGPLLLFSTSLSARVEPVINMVGTVALLMTYTVLFPPLLLRLALVFPHSKPIVRAHPRLEYLPFLIGALTILSLFTLGALLYAWTILSIVGTIAILTHSAFTLRDALSRAQLRWGLWGLSIALAMTLPGFLPTFGLLSGPLADLAYALTALSFGVLGLTLSIAILRYRLFDIDIIIRRTLIYGVLTALLLLLYFATVTLSQALLSTVSGKRSDVAIIISTLAIAALFIPLRNRVQHLIDRRFYRRKYDAGKVLAAFGATVRDEVDLQRLTDELLSAVGETMQPANLSLWLANKERGKDKFTR